ncbi:MAG TPA: CPBP family intramembrane metalloprotease [Clostridiales bacterium]|nr:CPBP family intramembrane metalloprotease [Clostridiales bacterium]
MFVTLFLLLLLTFSFRLIEMPLQKKHKKYTVYLWGILVFLLSLIVKDNYVFQLPENFVAVGMPFFIFTIIAVLLTGLSSFRPQSIYDRIAFAIAYPVFEEMAFRGILLAHLSQYSMFTAALPIPFFMNMNLAIVISAAVFALHLQFYKACWRYPGMIAITFFYGLILGFFAEATQSILLPLLIHLISNGVGASIPGRYHKKA